MGEGEEEEKELMRLLILITDEQNGRAYVRASKD
jgi:hypothetical protein